MSILIKVISENERPRGRYTQTASENSLRAFRDDHEADGGGEAAGLAEQLASELRLKEE